MATKKEKADWLSSAFGGLTGTAVKAKKTHKAQLEKAHKASYPGMKKKKDK